MFGYVRIYVCVYLTTLLLEEIALNYSFDDSLFFERRLRSRDSLLSCDVFVLATLPIKNSGM